MQLPDTVRVYVGDKCVTLKIHCKLSVSRLPASLSASDARSEYLKDGAVLFSGERLESCSEEESARVDALTSFMLELMTRAQAKAA